MKTTKTTEKQTILEAVENGAKVINKFNAEIGQGYRIENWNNGFKLSNGFIIRFEQVIEIGNGFIKINTI